MAAPTGGHDIIVIGASMGGVRALQELVRGLPANLRAAVFIVLHTDPRSPGLLAGILDSVGRLPVATAVDGEPVAFGEIRVARPDHHLMLEADRVRVIHGPKENRSRPSIDTLFRSAALAYGTRAIGVVLTGRLDDGTAGLWTIKRAGGIAVVQDPDDAEFPEMPKNARDAVAIDHSVPLARMAGLLTELAAAPSMAAGPPVEPHAQEQHYVAGVVYVCPDCKGPLRELETGNEKLVRFKCLVGHAFSMATLLEGHAEATEAALWSAVVSLEHEALFAERAAQHAATRDSAEAKALTAEAKRARAQGEVIRGLLTANPSRKADDGG